MYDDKGLFMTDKSKDTLLTFPCEFPVKAVGHDCEEFETAVLDIMKKHVNDFDSLKITKRPSKDGKYIAMTVLVTAHSKDQLDAIYQELTDAKAVLMAL